MNEQQQYERPAAFSDRGMRESPAMEAKRRILQEMGDEAGDGSAFSPPETQRAFDPAPESYRAAAIGKHEDAKVTHASFEYLGETYRVRLDAPFDLDVLEAQSGGDVFGATRLIVGPEQWRRFKDSLRRSDPDGRAIAATSANDLKDGHFAKFSEKLEAALDPQGKLRRSGS